MDEYKTPFDFFMSHKTECKPIVIEICELFISKGYKIWLDDEQLNVGDVLHDKLAEGILDSDCFIAFISKSYIESYNCQLEYKYALSKKKPAIFIILEKVEVPPGLDIYMSNSMRLDAYKESGPLEKLSKNSMRKLLKSIDRLKNNQSNTDSDEDIYSNTNGYWAMNDKDLKIINKLDDEFWIEYQDDKEFATFEFHSQDKNDDIILYDSSRNIYLKLFDDRIEFGYENINDIDTILCYGKWLKKPFVKSFFNVLCGKT